MNNSKDYQQAYHDLDFGVAGVLGRLDVWADKGATIEQIALIIKELNQARNAASASAGPNVRDIPFHGRINFEELN